MCGDVQHCAGSDSASIWLQVVPSRQVRGSTAATAKGRRKGVDAAQAGPADGASAVPADPTDQLPRTDISAQITDDLLRRLASPNWKVPAAPCAPSCSPLLLTWCELPGRQ
jgi:hypothetical protein